MDSQKKYPKVYSFEFFPPKNEEGATKLRKTREELAKEYVTKVELRNDMGILMDRIDKIGEKLDKLFEAK